MLDYYVWWLPAACIIQEWLSCYLLYHQILQWPEYSRGGTRYKHFRAVLENLACLKRQVKNNTVTTSHCQIPLNRRLNSQYHGLPLFLNFFLTFLKLTCLAHLVKDIYTTKNQNPYKHWTVVKVPWILKSSSWKLPKKLFIINEKLWIAKKTRKRAFIHFAFWHIRHIRHHFGVMRNKVGMMRIQRCQNQCSSGL